MGMLRAAVVAFAVAGAAGSDVCPGSDAFIHAWSEVTVAFASTSCATVATEIKARISGSASGSWTDPHNGGTYAVTSSSSSGLVGSRTTKNGQYTDKFGFSFSTVGAGCEVKGCSQSQVTSIADFSTNYCNLHDLYCGSQDGCTPAGSDYAYSETDVDTSIGASSDKSACLGGSRKTFLRVGAAVAEA